MSGTIVAQAIPVAISPILTRLYTPEEFGTVSIFIAITAILGSITTGKYELAILLPQKDEEALNIFHLCIFLTGVSSVTSFIFLIFFRGGIANWLGYPEIKNLLLLIPLSILFIGLFNSLNYFNIRTKNFKDVAKSIIFKSSGGGVTQLGLGYLQVGSIGLILGQVISFLTGNLVLLKRITEKHDILKSFNFNNIRKYAVRYKKFPSFSMPAGILNALTLNIISFLVSGIYTPFILGHYSLANRMLGIPSMVIGKSFSQVYSQKMASTKIALGNVNKIFRMTLLRLTIIAIPIFSILFLIAPPAFSFIFGKNWEIAGVYAQILIPALSARFISGSMSTTLEIFEAQQYSIVINLVLVITTVLIYSLANLLDLEFKTTLIIYSTVVALEYTAFILLYSRIVHNFSKKNIRSND